MKLTFDHAVLAALLGLPAGASDASFFVGPPAGTGSVEVHDGMLQPPQLPAGLEGVRLLPVALAGRSRIDELLAGSPRQRLDVPGASRIELPSGMGSLYAYVREDSGRGPSNFGYFSVNTGGVASSLWERPGAGPSGLDDPFLPGLAVDAAGATALVATTVAAGGDLVEIDLAAGGAVVRTGTTPPHAFQARSVRLLPTWGVANLVDGVLRFDRTPGAEAEAVSFPETTPFVGPGIVASADGNVAAIVGGTGPTAAHVYCFEPSGPARRVTENASFLSGAGFWPDSLSGPHLALSTDGSICAWRTEGVTRELWIRPVPVAATGPAAQVTSDQRFVDTLDSTGELIGFSATAVLAMVGEQDLIGGVEKADVYRVDFDPSTEITTVTNMSLTSGVGQTPFEPGQLASEDGLYRVDGFPGVLAFRDVGGVGGDLLAVRWDAPGSLVLDTGIKGLTHIERVGADLVVGLVREADDTNELIRLPSSLDTAPTVLASVPSDYVFRTVVPGQAGWFATLLDVPGGQWLARGHAPTSAVELLIELTLPLGPTVGFTADGGVAFTVDLPIRSIGVNWQLANSARLYPLGVRPGLLLPGR